MVLSPKVRRFAEAMQIRLNANAHKDVHDENGQRTGDGWAKDAPFDLFDRAVDEMHEVLRDLQKICGEREDCGDASLKVSAMARKLLYECADVANMLLMTADVSGAFDDS